MNLLEIPQLLEQELELLENFPLLETDDMPLESAWHRAAIALLIELVLYRFEDREDFYVGGNTFIYYNLEQARTLSYRGPDFFFVKDSHLHPPRRYWVVWRERGRYPNVIIELLSPTTAKIDRTTKFEIYERTFRTPEYFLYDPDARSLEGYRIGAEGEYEPLKPNERGWLWSKELGLWLGTWEGEYLRWQEIWLRFFDPQGQLVLNKEEVERQRAEVERQRAEVERQRAETAEAELKRLKALLGAEEGSSQAPGDSSS